MFIAIIRTVVLYAFVTLAVRLMGKRQISEMQPSELVVTMVISDIAAMPMQNASQPMLGGIVPVLVLVALEILVSVLMMKSRGFRRLICGRPVVIIENGRLLQSQMKRLRLTIGDLFAQLRQQEVFSLENVQYCIMETNGKLSILEQAQSGGNDVSRPEAAVISDGVVVEEALKLCGGERQQVDNILLENHLTPDKVFLMTLNDAGDYQIWIKDGWYETSDHIRGHISGGTGGSGAGSAGCQHTDRPMPQKH